MLDEVTSQILYGLSGFLFGVFSCRYGTISTNKMKPAWAEKGLSFSFLLTAMPSLIFLIIAVFLVSYLDVHTHRAWCLCLSGNFYLLYCT